MAQTTPPTPRVTIPEPVQQWMDLTQTLIGAASGWAAGDPEHDYPEARNNLRRVMVLNDSLRAALRAADNLRNTNRGVIVREDASPDPIASV